MLVRVTVWSSVRYQGVLRVFLDYGLPVGMTVDSSFSKTGPVGVKVYTHICLREVA